MDTNKIPTLTASDPDGVEYWDLFAGRVKVDTLILWPNHSRGRWAHGILHFVDRQKKIGLET